MALVILVELPDDRTAMTKLSAIVKLVTDELQTLGATKIPDVPSVNVMVKDAFERIKVAIVGESGGGG